MSHFMTLVPVGYSGNFSKVSEKFLEACAEVGIPYIPDINTSAGCIGSSKVVSQNSVWDAWKLNVLNTFPRSVRSCQNNRVIGHSCYS